MNDLISAKIQGKMELKRREYRENPFLIIRDGLLKIKTKAGTYEKFIPNNIQLKLLTIIENLWFKNRVIRLRVLKARQEGVSTLIEAVLCVLTAMIGNQNALILADDIKGSNYLFDMSKLYHEGLKKIDPLLVPDLAKSNEKGLKYQGNKSQIVIETSDNKEAGRKYTFRIVHCSEVAFFKNAGELMTGLRQAVPREPRTLIIEETTANGVGGYFYDGWNNPKDDYSEWVNVFFGWQDHEEYSIDFDNDIQRARLSKTLGIDNKYNDYPGEEKDLASKQGCTLEQLHWRRWAIANNCDGDLDKFHQEYPAYPEQAFLVSGRPRFNVKILSKMKTTVNPVIQTGYLVNETPEKVIIEDNPKGYVQIFKPPVNEKLNSRRYVLGGDVAEGILPIEGKKDPDFSSLHVLDRRTLEQVATWHGRIDPDLLGLEAIKLARYYNNAFIGIERNNHGLVTVTRIKNENYWNVYQTTSFDAILDKESVKLGWVTSTRTKPLMIDELAQMIREMTIKINDLETIKELMTYVIDEDGKTNAQQGCFDDRVMGLAIAGQMIKAWFDIADKQDKPEDTEGTFAYYKKQIEDDLRKPVIV